MPATRTRQHGRGRHRAGAPRGAPMYYGWSHDDSRMRMMDLEEYLDSLRAGYERGLEDLQEQIAAIGDAVSDAMAATPTAYLPGAPDTGRRWGHRHGHDHDCGCGHHHDCGCGHDHHHDHHHGHHDHHHHHDHGCGCHDHGCGHRCDCHCECCIVDADIVVYARCGEIRRIPIEIDNDTRKVREGVTLEVSDMRTAGGRKLPWVAMVNPTGPLTLEACSTERVELVVAVKCDSDDDTGAKGDTAEEEREIAAARAAEEAGYEKAYVKAATVNRQSLAGSVDECVVGYVTIRVGGCVVRPIVVAVAAVPDDCGAHHAGCSCPCC